LAVLSFFLFSGFLIGYNSTIGHAGDSNYLQYTALKRAVHIIIPCIVVSTVGWVGQKIGLVYNEVAHSLGADDYVVSVFVTPPNLGNLKLNILDLFINLNTPFAPQMWTIHYEIIGGSICFCVLAIVGKKKIRVFIEMMAILISVLALGDKYFEAIFVGLFISELIESQGVDRFSAYHLEKKRFIMLIFLLIMLLDISVFLKTGGIKLEYLSVIVMGMALLVAHIVWGEKNLSSRIARTIRVFGELSFSFYLIHFIVIVSVGARVFVLMRERSLTVTWSYVSALLGSFFVSLVFSVALQNCLVKPTDRLFRMIYEKL
jgi:peptidoglycan/LPS O-acetylase OafA/YrhL